MGGRLRPQTVLLLLGRLLGKGGVCESVSVWQGSGSECACVSQEKARVLPHGSRCGVHEPEQGRLWPQAVFLLCRLLGGERVLCDVVEGRGELGEVGSGARKEGDAWMIQ